MESVVKVALNSKLQTLKINGFRSDKCSEQWIKRCFVNKAELYELSSSVTFISLCEKSGMQLEGFPSLRAENENEVYVIP